MLLLTCVVVSEVKVLLFGCCYLLVDVLFVMVVHVVLSSEAEHMNTFWKTLRKRQELLRSTCFRNGHFQKPQIDSLCICEYLSI